jgi:hypothetical protein
MSASHFTVLVADPGRSRGLVDDVDTREHQHRTEVALEHGNVSVIRRHVEIILDTHAMVPKSPTIRLDALVVWHPWYCPQTAHFAHPIEWNKRERKATLIRYSPDENAEIELVGYHCQAVVSIVWNEPDKVWIRCSQPWL